MDQISRNAFLQSATRQVEPALVAAVEQSALRHHPFDYIYMDDVIDGGIYDELLDALPDRRFYHELTHRDALRGDGSSTRLRMYLYPELLWRLPLEQRRAWMPVARALCSRKLQDAFKRKFRQALEDRFGKPIEQIGLYPVPILLRDQPGYRIGIHSDVLTKAITVQYYLPRDGSQRHIGTIFHESNTEQDAEPATRMAFMPASGYAFPVTASKSWHSVAQTSEQDGERVSMMLTYYATDGLAAQTYRRLRRTALFFGLHPKG